MSIDSKLLKVVELLLNFIFIFTLFIFYLFIYLFCYFYLILFSIPNVQPSFTQCPRGEVDALGWGSAQILV